MMIDTCKYFYNFENVFYEKNSYSRDNTEFERTKMWAGVIRKLSMKMEASISQTFAFLPEILEYLTNSGFNQWTHLNLSHIKFGVREFQHQNSSFRVSSKTQKAFCVYLSSFSKMSIL